jgi:nicotinate-nucleotide--dimethylbenzimidazole phosphoribosyltransferase
MPDLSIAALTVTHAGRKVLEDVDLVAHEGEVTALVGPNGAGKTTLIRALSGAVSPDYGTARLGEVDILGLSARRRARLLAVVPQAGTLPGDFTAAEIVLLGRTPHVGGWGSENGRDREAAWDALRAGGIEALARRRARDLSGGEQKLVVIARALAQEPSALLLDEATAHLDIEHGSAILRLVRTLARTKGLAVLATFHDLGLAAVFSDRMAILRAGRMIACGRPRDVLTPENLREAYGAGFDVVPHPVRGTPLVVPGAAALEPREARARGNGIPLAKRPTSLDLPVIPPIDESSAAAARARQESLTKPPGSLGRLEELAIRLAGIQGNPLPSLSRRAVVVMAADHGVAAEGVSAYPAEVTRQMVLNFLRGGAAIDVLARQARARLVVINIGVSGPLPLAESIEPSHPDCTGRDRRIGPGTANMTLGPAMSRSDAEAAIRVGIETALEEAERGLDLVAAGEMGIGNTTAAAAITAALTGIEPARVTGRGTGVSGEALERKIRAIETALSVNRPDPDDPLEVLAAVGGFEIAGLAGVMLGAASRRIPVVVDGFISGAAALAACALSPGLERFLVAGHRSAEPGHRAILERLGLEPLLDLGLRLGEGTGAALAFHILDAAVLTLRDMATFAEAGVDVKAP